MKECGKAYPFHNSNGIKEEKDPKIRINKSVDIGWKGKKESNGKVEYGKLVEKAVANRARVG